MHFDMHVYLLEKVLLCSFDSNNFCKFCTIFGPQMEVEKWTQKWCQNLIPKMGSKNGTQKDIGSPFWVPFLDPILGIKFWHHFWVHFSTSILGPKMVQNLQKLLPTQSCIAKLFPANKHAYQNASVVISQLIASFNTIQSSTWSSLPK